uniref:Cerebellar deration related protein 2 n=1 Tax=Lepisosteus oculatus TaxID=7918 RepID=W5MNX8_LEPOC
RTAQRRTRVPRVVVLPTPAANMLTDMMVEEEFEIKEEEPWYDHRDLEHDLHLAAELGKTLLDRNRELEEGLQQMYSTNQEQLQEIEHLSKQVDLLRQMNEQHAKLYEQLDVSARELELTNQRLVVENRSSQHRIQGLTETIESLQAQVEELQRQAEELRAPRREDRLSRDLAEQCRSTTTQSVSCLKELYDMRNRAVPWHAGCYSTAPVPVSGFNNEGSAPEIPNNERLADGGNLVQVQVKVVGEQWPEIAPADRLVLKDHSQSRGRIPCGLFTAARQRHTRAGLSARGLCFPFLQPRAHLGSEQPRADRAHQLLVKSGGPERRPLKRCSSAEEIRRGHERTCARRSEAVKQRGISLLNEVDAQYSALQVKYEELLRRCQLGEDGLSHKAVQTARRPSRGALPLPSPGADEPLASPDGQQPEYKALFQEIFSCIQKTKEDLSENR